MAEEQQTVPDKFADDFAAFESQPEPTEPPSARSNSVAPAKMMPPQVVHSLDEQMREKFAHEEGRRLSGSRGPVAKSSPAPESATVSTGTTIFPEIASADEYASLPAGEFFVDRNDPGKARRQKPHLATSLEDYRQLPEGSFFIDQADPDQSVRQKPVYEGLDTLTQATYNNSTNDKERKNALERRYKGKVRVEEGTGDLYIDDDGVKRKPKAFNEAVGAGVLGAAVPVGASAIGGIVGGISGGPVGAIGLAGAGAAAGQAFNDIVLSYLGIYDRSGWEEAGELAKAGVMGSVGEVTGRAAGFVAPAASAAIRHGPGMAAASILGADLPSVETRLGLLKEGVKEVRPSAWAFEAPHVKNVAETQRYKFKEVPDPRGIPGQSVNPDRAEAIAYYERTVPEFIKDTAGIDVPSPVSRTKAKISSREAGEAVLKRVDTEAKEANATYDRKFQEAKAKLDAGAELELEEQAQLVKSSEEANAKADKILDIAFKDIERDMEDAGRIAKASSNAGALHERVGEKLRVVRTALNNKAEEWLAKINDIAGDHLPPLDKLQAGAKELLNQFPQDFGGFVPSIVQELRKITGVVGREVEEAGTGVQTATGERELTKPPTTMTWSELHKLRTAVRAKANWYTLRGGSTNPVYKKVAGLINEAMHGFEDVPALKTASKMQDAFDKWYKSRVQILNSNELNAVLKGLQDGAPADPKKLFDLINKPHETELAKAILKTVGKPMASEIRAHNVLEMIRSARNPLSGKVDSSLFAEQIVDRLEDGRLEALHTPEVVKQLKDHARNLQALRGKVEVDPIPGDTALDVMLRARGAAKAAEEAANRDPLKVLKIETEKLKTEIEAEKQGAQAAKAEQAGPIAFIYNKSLGAEAAADKLLVDADHIMAAAETFGTDSVEWQMLRQVAVQRVFENTLNPGGTYARLAPKVQDLLFPGVSKQTMETIAKNMDFLIGAHEGDFGGSLMAQALVEHPFGGSSPFQAAGNVALGHTKVRNVLGANWVGRMGLSRYYEFIARNLNKQWVLEGIANGLRGDAKAREMTRRMIQRNMQLGGAAGSVAGEGLYQAPREHPQNELLQGFAQGGTPAVGRPIVVGEQGPEMVMPGLPGGLLGGRELGMHPGLPQQASQMAPQGAPGAMPGQAPFAGTPFGAMLGQAPQQPFAGTPFGSMVGHAPPLPTGGGADWLTAYGQLRGYAEGGQPPTGEPIVVGEDGPEVIQLNQPGTVIPNPATQAQQARESAAGRMQRGMTHGQPDRDYIPTITDFIQSVPTGAVETLMGLGSRGGQAAQIEMGQPVDVPDPSQAMDSLQQGIGQLHQPTTPAGEAGRFVGGRAADPLSYVGGGAAKAIGTAAISKGSKIGLQGLLGEGMLGAESAMSTELPEQGGPGAAVPVGQRDPHAPEWWRTKREDFKPEEFKEPPIPPDLKERYAPETLRAQGPKESNSRYRGYAKPVEDRNIRKETDLKLARKDIVDAARVEHSKNEEQRLKEHQKQQDQLDKDDQEYKAKNQNFRRRFGNAATAALPLIGATIGGWLGRVPRAARKSVYKEIQTKLDEAILEGEKVASGSPGLAAISGSETRLKAATKAAKKIDPTATSGAQADIGKDEGWGSVGTGAAFGGTAGAGSLLYDLETLPSSSPDRADTKDPMQWLYRMGGGALLGAEAGKIGSRAMKPVVPDTAKAEGVTAKLGQQRKDILGAAEARHAAEKAAEDAAKSKKSPAKKTSAPAPKEKSEEEEKPSDKVTKLSDKVEENKKRIRRMRQKKEAAE